MSEEEPLEEIPAGGKKSSLLLIILGVVAGLLVGGGVVYVLFGMDKGPETAPVEETVEEAPAPAPAANLLIIPVRRFAVPLINGDRQVLGYMWVDLAFEVDGPENQSFVAARLPELKDAFLRDLHAARTTREDRPGALDFDLLQERLDAATEKVAGEGRVLAVRITNAIRAPE